MLSALASRFNLLKQFRQGNFGDAVFKILAYFFGLFLLFITLFIMYQLLFQGIPAIREFGIGFLWSTEFDPVQQQFGALQFIQGTLVTAFISMFLAAPIGIGIAAFLVEIAPERVNRVVGFLVEMLAAIPSVVYGLWGIFVLAPFLRTYVEPWLIPVVGWIPGFEGPFRGYSVFTASLVLTIMILPTVAAISRNVFQAVPRDQREAMLALGSTRWEMFSQAVLPYAKGGVIGALALALGRAAGETMAVTIIIGNARRVFTSVFDQGATIASVIAGNFTDASGGVYISSLFLLGFVLFILTLSINVAARLLIRATSTGPTNPTGGF
ncbi:MAG: phosphate ABC transporter permease subunit PstC [Rubrobacter sp.]|jgi:phosphate transport system permease protein|nr:phosphate ABC transporter permease subunit PstC [Rubrobacter sp.]